MIINPFDNEQEFTSSDKLITHLTQLAVDKNNVFRGYGKQSELFPNIIREKDWREQEIRLLHEFERYGLQYFSANNPIDFMSYAQHYGLPTRLLDFTYNPFIALYFSLFTPKGTNYTYEEDRIYYYMRYCSLNDQIHIRTLPYFDETLFRSASFAVQSNRMIYLLNRIIRGLKEEADEHDTGVKAIVNYFARIYYDDHPSKSVESLTENPNFKSFLDDEITKFEQKRILFVDANQCNLEMSRNVQSGNTQNLKSMVIQRSFPKWSVAERRKTAAASDQAAVCACAHSRYFAGGSPSGLRV